MADDVKNPQVTDNNMESKAVEKLNEKRNTEPVNPTPTTESGKAPENNQLSDNELKAENELKELDRLKELHISDDQHKEAAVKEQLEYERGQREQREQGLNDEHPEVAHGQSVTDKETKKREDWEKSDSK